MVSKKKKIVRALATDSRQNWVQNIIHCGKKTFSNWCASNFKKKKNACDTAAGHWHCGS